MGVSFVKFAPVLAMDFTANTLSDVFSNARYQRGSVALRNRKFAAISINGIPPGSTFRKAYLYWM